jgi:Ion channel
VHLIAAAVGIMLLIAILRDAFETIILPRRVQRRFPLTRIFYRGSWHLWRGCTSRLSSNMRQNSLSWYGPLSLLILLGLWALCIVFAFGVLHWSAGSAIKVNGSDPHFFDDLYLSGTTFFTLGMGDVVPAVSIAKVITVFEAGIGFAFLAIIIGYLPVIYQAFSRREIAISMLDARAGSPPTAGELLRRHGVHADQRDLAQLLSEWERWSAEVLESHLSYPALAYFRSQHGNQSWLAALTTVLDTSALVMVGFDGMCMRQASLTFAMARHAVVDLAQVFSARQPDNMPERLGAEKLHALVAQLGEEGLVLQLEQGADRLAELREMYEPYVYALSLYLALPLPQWLRDPEHAHADNWEGAPWHTKGKKAEHF